MPTGYSGTPLARKLGIKEGFKLAFYQRPAHYFDLFSDLPDRLEIVEKTELQSIDFAHLFCTSFDELKANAAQYKDALKKNGLLWISWPKGKSGISTDLKRDLIREYGIEIGLVDVKVAAIDEDWSGLKFVYRKKDR
jgi:hypothetical protein